MATELFAPRIEVTLDDGAAWTVQTANPDLVAWDMTAARHRWPPVKDAPFLWLTFIAWHASRRKGQLPDRGMTWEQFRDHAVNIVGPGADTDTDTGEDDDDPGIEGDPAGAGMAVIRPTRPAHAPG